MEKTTDINEGLLGHIRDFWFRDLPDPGAIPDDVLLKRWFFRSDEYDRECRNSYKPILELIREKNVTGADFLQRFPDPSHQLPLILLLDQIPRNVYRGTEASIAYQFFDPIALHIASVGLSAKDTPLDQTQDYRLNIAYRTWFLNPAMHSENLLDHELARVKYRAALNDIDSPDYPAEKRQAAREYVERQWSFEKKHLEVLERFGRYV